MNPTNPVPRPSLASRARCQRIGWTLVAVAGLGGAAMLGRQWVTNATLRAEFAALGASQEDPAGARAENTRLRAGRISEAELASLRSDRAALERMRRELDDVRQQVNARESPGPGASPPAVPAARTQARSVHEMRNVGRTTPVATGETFVWALQHGEIEAAAALMVFPPAARARMEAIVAALPESVRAQYDTPEKLMAFVMAGSPGVAALRVLGEEARDERTVAQKIEVRDGHGGTRTDTILFEHDGTAWRRIIPLQTVDKLAEFLRDRPPAAGKTGP